MSENTDPTGLAFLSYKRERAGDAKLLVDALRDRGVPTWQDVSDLPTEPSEAALRQTLDGASLSSAVLFITPEVERSSVITKVEAPLIIARHLRGDGFFVVPVVAGGLQYADVERVLGPDIGLPDMTRWNLHRVTSDPLTAGDAAVVAELVLRQRLAAIHARLPSDAPLDIRVSTRAALPKQTGPALSLDLCHRFQGRVATAEDWTAFVVPAFRSVAHASRMYAPGREVRFSGPVAIPAATALGVVFLAASGLRASWNQDQQTFGKPSESWSLERPREPSHYRAERRDGDPAASDFALLVSVAANVTQDFAAVRPSLPPLRGVIAVEPPPVAARSALSAGQALDVAHLAVDAARAFRTTHHARGTMHLFMAAPVGLAMLIGQLLNTFGSLQTYEHVPGSDSPYRPAALLSPSH